MFPTDTDTNVHTLNDIRIRLISFNFLKGEPTTVRYKKMLASELVSYVGLSSKTKTNA